MNDKHDNFNGKVEVIEDLIYDVDFNLDFNINSIIYVNFIFYLKILVDFESFKVSDIIFSISDDKVILFIITFKLGLFFKEAHEIN